MKYNNILSFDGIQVISFGGRMVYIFLILIILYLVIIIKDKFLSTFIIISKGEGGNENKNADATIRNHFIKLFNNFCTIFSN